MSRTHAHRLIFAITLLLAMATDQRALIVLAADPAPPQKPTNPGVAASKIKWKKTTLDAKFRSEGVAIGDFNHDGKLDIAAGSVWYEAPDWKMHSILDQPKEYDPHNYSNSFCCFAEDLNGDGWTDLIVVDFPGKETWWFENPKQADKPWPRHELAKVTNNESPTMWPLLADGKRQLVCATAPTQAGSDGADRTMAFFTRADDPLKAWDLHSVSAKAAPLTTKYSHGLGVGDVNGDGRSDIITHDGWYEAPADALKGDWKWHPAKIGVDCSQMYVFDFNGDGRNDILSASAHRRGIWWHEQLADGSFKTHEIDTSFTQTHSVCFADINGDGLPDIITGKRWWAHGPSGDEAPGDPAVLFWFELTRKDGQPVWTPHEIDHDSGVGTQFEVGDVNGDGLPDIAISNKKGVFLFEQVRE